MNLRISYVTQTLLATGLGSSPSIATIIKIGIEFVVNSIVSGMFYDAIVGFLHTKERSVFMRILFLGGLGVGCGDIV